MTDAPENMIEVRGLLSQFGERTIHENLDLDLVRGEVMGVVVAGMSMENVLPRLTEGAVVLIPGDRSEVLLAVLMLRSTPRACGPPWRPR